MKGEITFQDSTPRDMNVRLDGVVVGYCSRTQWKSNGTMLYRWTARLDERRVPPDGTLDVGERESMEAATKAGIKRLVVDTVRAAPEPGKAPMPVAWTILTDPDPATGAFKVRIAPPFHEGPGLTLATACSDMEEARRFSGLVDAFLGHMVEGLAELEGEALETDASDWTHVYLDRRFYVRLVPGCMDLEAAGYSHGLAVEGQFQTKPEAEAHALTVGAEMSAMVGSLAATLPPGDPRRDAFLAVAAPSGTAGPSVR
jgi:hypothetical protein